MIDFPITEAAIERLKVHAHLIRRVRDGSGHAVADAIDALLADREEARIENEDLRLTILGGEDAPGLAASLSLAEIKDIHRENFTASRDRALTAERIQAEQAETIKRLRAALRKIDASPPATWGGAAEWMRNIAHTALSTGGTDV